MNCSAFIRASFPGRLSSKMVYIVMICSIPDEVKIAAVALYLGVVGPLLAFRTLRGTDSTRLVGRSSGICLDGDGIKG